MYKSSETVIGMYYTLIWHLVPPFTRWWWWGGHIQTISTHSSALFCCSNRNKAGVSCCRMLRPSPHACLLQKSINGALQDENMWKKLWRAYAYVLDKGWQGTGLVFPPGHHHHIAHALSHICWLNVPITARKRNKIIYFIIIMCHPQVEREAECIRGRLFDSP